LFHFEFYVTVFIYPASAAKHNKRMWNVYGQLPPLVTTKRRIMQDWKIAWKNLGF